MPGAVKVFLVLVACAEPDYTLCQWIGVSRQPDPEVCEATRVRELRDIGMTLPEGVRAFGRCQLVLEERDDEAG